MTTKTANSQQLVDEVLDNMEPYVLGRYGRDSAAWRSGDFTAGAMLEFKSRHGDGRLAHWTVADVHEFLMNWLPAFVQTDDEVLQDVPQCAPVFFDFLAHAGYLTGDPPAELTAACERLGVAFLVAVKDEQRWSPAKSRLAAIAAATPEGAASERPHSQPQASADRNPDPPRTRAAAGPRNLRSAAWPRFARR